MDKDNIYNLNDLKHQFSNKQQNNDTSNYRKYVFYSILFAIFTTIFIFMFIFLKKLVSYDNVDNPYSLSDKKEVSENAYFMPNENMLKGGFYRGRIDYVGNNIERGVDVNHKLVDQEGKIVAYLFSNKIDLDISAGLQVEVQGKIRKNKIKDIIIIDVDKLKIK